MIDKGAALSVLAGFPCHEKMFFFLLLIILFIFPSNGSELDCFVVTQQCEVGDSTLQCTLCLFHLASSSEHSRKPNTNTEII